MGEPTPEPEHEPDSRRGAVLGLIIVAVLVLGGLLLAHILRKSAQLQDCALSGRTDCAPIDTGGADR
jgi:hypothetical protein